MAKITYENKVALNVNSDIADVNKCNATDLNEIKEVVNTNDDNDISKGTYSTNETRIGTWMGKPLYRKSIKHCWSCRRDKKSNRLQYNKPR